MRQYQKMHYRHYYAQDVNGDYIPVTRAECFAPGDTPTKDNPYKQRWFYDFEAGYAVRLIRDKNADEVGKRNEADLKAESRKNTQKWGCIWEGKKGCGGNCDVCTNTFISRTEELDKQLDNGFDYAAEDSDPAGIYENVSTRQELHKAVAALPDDEQKIIALAFGGLSVSEAARKLGLPRKTFAYRKDMVVSKLKNYFNKS